jgi:drug/metabolite transporter (DMT)-like permease
LYKELKKEETIDRSDLWDLAKLGFLSISIYFWLQYTGVKYSGAGISALIVIGFIPILTGIISAFVLKEQFTGPKILGTVMGFIGVSLITIPGLILGNVNTKFYLGIGALLVNSICFSLYSSLSRKLMKKIDKPIVVTGLITIFGTIGLIPMSITSDWSLILSMTMSNG